MPTPAGGVFTPNEAVTMTPEQVAEERLTLARELGRAAAELKRWDEYKKTLTKRLTHLHGLGLIETKFTAAGFTISLQAGRSGVSVDDEGKMQQQALLDHLIKEGHAEPKIGDPFWTVRDAPKPKGNA
jgi:hypothetical protein